MGNKLLGMAHQYIHTYTNGGLSVHVVYCCCVVVSQTWGLRRSCRAVGEREKKKGNEDRETRDTRARPSLVLFVPFACGGVVVVF